MQNRMSSEARPSVAQVRMAIGTQVGHGRLYFLSQGTGDGGRAPGHARPALSCRGDLLGSWLAAVCFALFETGSRCGVQAGLELCSPPVVSLVLGFQVCTWLVSCGMRHCGPRSLAPGPASPHGVLTYQRELLFASASAGAAPLPRPLQRLHLV